MKNGTRITFNDDALYVWPGKLPNARVGDLAPAIWVQRGGPATPVWAQAMWSQDFVCSGQTVTDSTTDAVAHDRSDPGAHGIVAASPEIILRTWSPLVTLRQLLTSTAINRPIAASVRVALLVQAARAVAARESGYRPNLLVESGPLHRTVSAEGALRRRSVQQEELEPSRAGSIKGTLAYLSTEEVLGRKVTAATGSWELGHLLFHMMFPSHRPLFSFPGGSVMDSLEAIRCGKLPPLPAGIPEPLQKLLTWCLAADPQERCPSPDVFVGALLDAVKVAPAEAAQVAATVRQRCAREVAQQEMQMKGLTEHVSEVEFGVEWDGETTQMVRVADPHRATVQVEHAGKRVLLDQRLVSRADYALFALETGAERGVSARGAPESPMVNVSFNEASAYARWAKKRLPRAEEIRAAVQLGALGDTPDDNVAQWTADKRSARIETAPVGASLFESARAVVERLWLGGGGSSPTVGFRCALDLG